MLEYRFAFPEDRQDIVDFIDLVFSMHSGPTNFEKLLPKVYAPEANLDAWHVIAVENQRIRGCVALRPFTYHVAGHTLRGGYVGSVSVHPSVRGRGVMADLMHRMLDRAEAEGLDFLALGGLRQRYAYYGFHPCGSLCEHEITPHNIRHALKHPARTDEICFEPLTEADASRAFELYNRQTVAGARIPEQFTASCRSFNHEPMVILLNGNFAGYLITNKDRDVICECLTEDPSLLPAVAAAWGKMMTGNKLTWAAMPWETSLQQFLSSFSQNFALRRDQMLRVLNPVSFVQAMVDLKLSLAPMADGTFRFPLSGKTMELSVRNRQASVSEVRTSAPFEADDGTVLLSLFGPDPMPTLPGCPAGWLPLPFAIPAADTF